MSPSIGARISASSGGATYVKTTSGSIITVVPKSLATLGGKIISSNIVSGESETSGIRSAGMSVTHPGKIEHERLTQFVHFLKR